MSAPRTFWASGGDVLMRVHDRALCIDADTQIYLMDLNADERRSAAKAVEVHGSPEASALWRAAYERHNELAAAIIEAGRWVKASAVRS